MAKTKWRCREYKATGDMPGTHSFYAEAVINSEIDNNDLSQKIAARTGFKSYEVKAVIAAVADIVAEEVLESNRISLCDENGTKMVSIYPKVSGRVSDEDILKSTTEAHALDPSVEIRNKAEESDLTPDRLTWTLGATIGIKFSKEFASHKQAQKVAYNATDTVVTDEGGSNSGSNGSNSGTSETPGTNTGGDTGGEGGDNNGGGVTPPGGNSGNDD